MVRKEQRALAISKWGNLFMGAAGALAAWLSNSQALMLDGLFSLIGFTSAVLGSRVASWSTRLADRRRPLGYAADGSIFLTFRSLSLLGLVACALLIGILNIFNYATGGAVPTLRYGPIIVYFMVICATCVGLALVLRAAWLNTGKRSDILHLEMRAALFDT